MTRFPMLTAAAMLAAAWCCGAADLYRVAGVVVNADTGAPLPRAFVAVQRTGTTPVVASQTTGDDGRFAFDLPQGKYSLHSGTRAALEVYGKRTPDNLVGTSIITGPEQNTAGLVFRWFPPGGISGKIVDEAGEPVENALVQLVRSNVMAGQRVTSTFGWTRTDDRGEYRFGRLLASTYYLAVTARPWYSEAPAFAPNTGAPSVAYAPVYYPNSLDKDGAAPLVLKSGEERRADFTLHTVAGATLKVTYDNPQGLSGLVGLITEGIGDSDGYERQENLMPFGQTLQSVAPGHYMLRVKGTRGTASVTGTQRVEVTGTDLEVKVVPLPAPSVSGTIQLKNPGMKPRGTIAASLVRLDTGAVVSTAMRPDGAISFPEVAPGKYRPVVRGTDSYFASEVHVEGAEIQDGVMELLEGTSAVLRMVASDETGRVQGLVMRGEQAAEGMMVVLAPVSENATAPPARGFQTDSDGSFDYQSVPAGDYFLFAVDESGIEYSKREVIRPYLGNAKRIKVEAHQSYSERIVVATVVRQ